MTRRLIHCTLKGYWLWYRDQTSVIWPEGPYTNTSLEFSVYCMIGCQFPFIRWNTMHTYTMPYNNHHFVSDICHVSSPFIYHFMYYFRYDALSYYTKDIHKHVFIHHCDHIIISYMYTFVCIYIYQAIPFISFHTFHNQNTFKLSHLFV